MYRDHTSICVCISSYNYSDLLNHGNLAPISRDGTSLDQNPKSVHNWVQNLNQTIQEVTKIHFYLHRLWCATAVAIAQANSTDSSPTLFGLVYIKEVPLTIGAELSSELVGYTQGITVSAHYKKIVHKDVREVLLSLLSKDNYPL
ncbi:UNVERIFIED_CONTAM: hypothetical protein Sradi_1572500 [Sesamum radiatum]|uniref:Dirigent protein n=1 Tax=Sesamum radiatum TaxID=300843 RepID=A0AAW2UA71_SESRA